MNTHNLPRLLSAALLLLAGCFITSCERELDDLEPAAFPTNGDVFIDGFSGGLEYAAFGGSKPTAFDVDTEVKFEGTTSMRFAVPDFEDPEGAYAGGSFFTSGARDLSSYTALTFWARASTNGSIDVIGFGNDLGENRLQTAINGLSVNTNWQKYYIPIPDPAKLTEEKGMLFYSEGPENELGYTFWLDEVQYENLGTIRPIEGLIYNGEDRVVTAEAGTTITPEVSAIFNLPTGVDQLITTTPAFFTFISSNPSVATVDDNGVISILDAGEATITALMGDLEARGSVVITSTGQSVRPTQKAPAPTFPAEEVISIYSNEYTNIPVDFYNGFWEFSTTQNEFTQVEGDDIIRYTDLNFVGIQFTSPTVDASSMNRFRIDVWTPIPVEAGTEFKVKLFDVGADQAFGTGDDSESELTFTSPQLQSETWVTIDLPMSAFSGTGLTNRNNLAQVVLSGTNLPTVFVDNVILYEGEDDGGTGDAPSMAAPTPTAAAGDVISIFSNAYNDVPVDTWRTEWSMATFADVQVDGNDTKLYTDLNFVGIETVMSQIDASGMDNFHFDLWTPNATIFKVKLVDFGPNGQFDETGGDDTEHELTFESPAQGQWVSYNIPLSDFVGLTNRNNIAQFIYAAEPSGGATAYIDNIYFSQEGSGGGTEPTMAAPTPADPAGNVISLFSEAYNDVGVDTWRTEWSMADFADVQVAGNDTKLYTNLNFVGIETTGANLVDATSMTHFRFDYWSPNATIFKVKLVDFGPDGQFDGGDDTEHEIVFEAPATSQWVSYDIPLSDFVGLINRNNVAQLIFAAEPSGGATAYIDNVYFRN